MFRTNTFIRSAIRTVKPVSTKPFLCKRLYATIEPSGDSVAFIVAGPGYLDGSDIVETVSASIHFGAKGYKVVYFTPDGNQEETVNHSTKETDVNEIRDYAVEATRVTRVAPLKLQNFRAENYKALFIPGGAAVTKIFSNFDEKKSNFSVDTAVEKVIKDCHSSKKPILAVDNAGILLAKVLGTKSGGEGVRVTVGSLDKETEELFQAVGASHAVRDTTDVVVDEDNLVYTSPAFGGKSSAFNDVHAGIGKLVKEVLANTTAMGIKKEGGGKEKELSNEQRIENWKKRVRENAEKAAEKERQKEKV
ncbi:glutamine amidotransferase domain-containing protein, mitochondrial [Acrasis kona]|uniref:Glutamine amidotransferase domain-containing protein, mitochondrial n=1 Tax=Acrasis kona TaxID=1008807 RepID=A0AAW2YY89_9EUKA